MKTTRNLRVALEIQKRLIGTRIGIKTLSKDLCIEEDRVKQILKECLISNLDIGGIFL